MGAHRPPGYATPWRSLQMTLVEWSDDGDWVLERKAEPSLVVPARAVLLVRPGVRHRLCVGGPKAMRTCWLLLAYETGSGTDVLGAASLPPILVGPAAERVTSLARLATSDHSGSVARLAAAQAAFCELLAVLLAAADETRPSLVPDADRLVPALAHVKTHLSEHLSRTVLAERVGLSPTRFHYVFTQAIGKAPMEYVQSERMRHAQQLLTGSGLSAKQVAFQCGFQTAQYFSRAFKRSTGLPPGAFRRSFGRGRTDAVVPGKAEGLSGVTGVTATETGRGVQLPGSGGQP